MKNHYSIKPINCFVKNDILYGKNKKGLTKGKIIALCLYENEAVCFDIVLNDGSIFNYIPLHKVLHKKKVKDIDLRDLVYHNSNSLEISLNKISYLKKASNGLAYLRHRNEWIEIEKYIMSIDWYEGNDLLNLLKLKNGYFAFLPNHKIKIENKPLNKLFKKYVKIPETFKV